MAIRAHQIAFLRFVQNFRPRAIGQRPEVQLKFLGIWVAVMKLEGRKVSIIAAAPTPIPIEPYQLPLSISPTLLLCHVGLKTVISEIILALSGAELCLPSAQRTLTDDTIPHTKILPFRE